MSLCREKEKEKGYIAAGACSEETWEIILNSNSCVKTAMDRQVVSTGLTQIEASLLFSGLLGFSWKYQGSTLTFQKFTWQSNRLIASFSNTQRRFYHIKSFYFSSYTQISCWSGKHTSTIEINGVIQLYLMKVAGFGLCKPKNIFLKWNLSPLQNVMWLPCHLHNRDPFLKALWLTKKPLQWKEAQRGWARRSFMKLRE